MRVCARLVDYAASPSTVRPYLGQVFVTAGKEYDIHAVAVFEGIVLMLFVNDLRHPGWSPAWLFNVVDSALSADWICSTFPDDPTLILGPEFIAGDQKRYAAMVNLEPEQVERFWKHCESR